MCINVRGILDFLIYICLSISVFRKCIIEVFIIFEYNVYVYVFFLVNKYFFLVYLDYIRSIWEDFYVK